MKRHFNFGGCNSLRVHGSQIKFNLLLLMWIILLMQKNYKIDLSYMLCQKNEFVLFFFLQQSHTNSKQYQARTSSHLNGVLFLDGYRCVITLSFDKKHKLLPNSLYHTCLT